MKKEQITREVFRTKMRGVDGYAMYRHRRDQHRIFSVYRHAAKSRRARRVQTLTEGRNPNRTQVYRLVLHLNRRNRT